MSIFYQLQENPAQQFLQDYSIFRRQVLNDQELSLSCSQLVDQEQAQLDYSLSNSKWFAYFYQLTHLSQAYCSNNVITVQLSDHKYLYFYDQLTIVSTYVDQIVNLDNFLDGCRWLTTQVGGVLVSHSYGVQSLIYAQCQLWKAPQKQLLFLLIVYCQLFSQWNDYSWIRTGQFFYSQSGESQLNRQQRIIIILILRYMHGTRNVIVTGSNKGIGYGIAENLAGKGWNVIMAVRNLALGAQAKKEILVKYPQAKLHLEHLDIADLTSIASFVPLVQQKYKTVDVLINNAGCAAKGDAFDSQVIKFTFDTNFYGTIELTEKMLPLIVDKGKIITIGSTAGKMSFKRITNEQLKDRFRKQAITKDQLLHLVHQFENDVKDNTYLEKGWPKWSYGISKLAINVYTTIIGRSEEAKKRGIQIYCCCPGFVKTDMSSHKGILTVDQGIITPIFLVQLPFEFKEELQGSFFYEQKKISLFE